MRPLLNTNHEKYIQSWYDVKQVLVKHGLGLVSGDTDYCLNARLLLYIRQTMNTLPDDIQDTIYTLPYGNILLFKLFENRERKAQFHRSIIYLDRFY